MHHFCWYLLSYEGGEVGGNVAHLGGEVVTQLGPVLRQLHDSSGEPLNVDHIHSRYVHSYTRTHTHARTHKNRYCSKKLYRIVSLNKMIGISIFLELSPSLWFNL